MASRPKTAACVIGLTGSFGTGKTTVARMFRKWGAKVLDADALAHEALAGDPATYREAVKAFGPGILDAHRTIDRRRLADAVFKDRKRLKTLCDIIHPRVVRTIKNEIKCMKHDDIVVIDAPLLIEAGLDTIVDALIVVTASRAQQLKRCADKFAMKKRDILDRIKNQLPLTRKAESADYVINNNGTIHETRKQALKIWRKLWR